MQTVDVRKGRRARTRTDFIVIHTTLTFPDQAVDAKVIEGWHRQRGFDGIGYHEVFLRDGTIEKGRPLDEFGAHTIGYNGNSVGLVLCGGYERVTDERLTREQAINPIPEKWVVKRDARKATNVVVCANYTEAQMMSLAKRVAELRARYTDDQGVPPAVVGHRDLSRDGRSCPAFDVKKWWAEVLAGRTPTSVKTEW